MDSMIEASVRAEAARYCDRHEIRDYASFQRIQAAIAFEQFRKAIEPYQHAITRIYLLRLLELDSFSTLGVLERATNHVHEVIDG